MPKQAFKFGETVKVRYRKDDHPYKYMLFVKEHDRRMYNTNSGIFLELTDGKGSFGMYDVKEVLPLSKRDKKILGIGDDNPTELAIEIMIQYGGIDGAHHKMWVIDQALRLLMGDEGYQVFSDQEPDWDTGISP